MLLYSNLASSLLYLVSKFRQKSGGTRYLCVGTKFLFYAIKKNPTSISTCEVLIYLVKVSNFFPCSCSIIITLFFVSLISLSKLFILEFISVNPPCISPYIFVINSNSCSFVIFSAKAIPSVI